MKTRHLILILIPMLCSMFSQAQINANPSISRGTNLIGIGFGPGRAFYGSGGFGPAIRIHYEHGTFKAGPGVITLGASFGYSYFNDTYHIGNDVHGGSWTSFAAGIRSAWHCSWGVNKLDTYAGLACGTRVNGYSKANYFEPKPYYRSVNAYFGGFLGITYYFSNKVGVFAEGGYDISHATIGFDFKF